MELSPEKLGLENTEAKIYLALLELGPATVSEITAKAGVTRTLGYHALQKLAWNNLVELSTAKAKVITYTAKHPRNVVRYLENKERQWKKRNEEATRLLPEMVSLYRMVEKPVINYREGVSGLMECWEEALSSKTEILSILDLEPFSQEKFRAYGKWWDKERSRRKIKERELILDTPSARDWMKYFRGSFKHTNCRYIDPAKLPGILEFGSSINIFENKTVLSLMKKPNFMGVIIESAALTNTLRALFELVWQAGVPAKRRKK